MSINIKLENNKLNDSPMIVGDDNLVIKQNLNNEKGVNELDNIIKGIIENLSDLDKENAENIKDIVEMAKEELGKPKPKVSRLRNCVSLIAPMFTIANGIPVLVENLQKLVDYISLYIKHTS